MKKIKPVFAVAAAMSCIGGVMASAMPAQADTGKPLEVLAGAANAYASQHLMQIYAGKPIDEGITIDPGNGYGQVMHPSIDQLKTLGYLPDGISGGDVRLEFSPAGCMAKQQTECDLLVRAAVTGDENTFTIPLRTVRRADDNPPDNAAQ
ncbi:hypothetical protein [Paraburkholderia humisilvae]|uniref:Uncharacterized protein n=1 Tax=Paraburkholderia humisilvae TaxID=627669 RepID=A0A6J5DLP8_9BURK|nr:hypothetical protein [Paraburkholderia humisilvae]CAB3754414.1 hypothetical protein LMG29542_02345 [Paraburkholderia humisilvae]